METRIYRLNTGLYRFTRTADILHDEGLQFRPDRKIVNFYQLRDLVPLTSKTDNQRRSQIDMGCISGNGPTQLIHCLSGHLAAAA